jgi:MFS-type transporter involved in bile tolerance (Atg22 family)
MKTEKSKNIVKSILLYVGGAAALIFIANHFILTPLFVQSGKPVNLLAVISYSFLSFVISIVPSLGVAIALYNKPRKRQNISFGVVCIVTLIILSFFFPIDIPTKGTSIENFDITVSKPDGSVTVFRADEAVEVIDGD